MDSLALSSRKRYMHELKHLHSTLQLTSPVADFATWLPVEWDRVERFLKTLPPTRAHLQGAMLCCLLRGGDSLTYAKALALLRQLPAPRPSAVKTSKEAAKWVPLSELKNYAKELGTRVQKLEDMGGNRLSVADTRLLFQHLVLTLNTDMPPLRNDVADMKFWKAGDSAHSGNIIVWRPGPRYTIVLRQYKTATTYGEKEIELPHKVNKVIYRSLKLFPRDYLVSQFHDGCKPMGSHYFSKFFRDIVPGKQLGSSMCRKIYVSWQFRNDKGEQFREALADKMAHSAAVARQHYEKH